MLNMPAACWNVRQRRWRRRLLIPSSGRLRPVEAGSQMSKAKLFAASILALALSIPGIAQNRPNSAAHEVQQPASSSARQAAGGEHAARPEASEEASPNDAFRHSSAVKLVARITGLSLDAAYWLCLVL